MGRAEQLSYAEAHERLSYNAETGCFAIKKHRRYASLDGRETHCLDMHGYVQVNLRPYGPLKGHRLAWMMAHGEWPAGQIDHINGVRDDNRIVNLRVVTNRINAQNKRKALPSNKLGVLGVTYRVRRGYRATVTHYSKAHCVPGSFATAEAAHAAYVALKRQLHEGCTL